VFQAGGLIVVLVEVGRKAYLASIVPVIVNAILNEHQIVVDIVAFVNKGDFPRSRLGEKQRGKILASWVTRKMRTMAQFGIRDPESVLADATEPMEPRGLTSSLRTGSVIASSLCNVEQAPQIPEQHETGRQNFASQDNFAPLPTGISEMPAINYNESIVESPTIGAGASMKSDDTPTNDRAGHFELSTGDFHPQRNDFLDLGGSFQVPGFENASDTAPPIGPKPTRNSILPAVEGREGDIWTLPSQKPAGGLRVQNAGSDDEDDDWKNDAMMHMNLSNR